MKETAVACGLYPKKRNALEPKGSGAFSFPGNRPAWRKKFYGSNTNKQTSTRRVNVKIW
jgi:hypothetical protein